MTAASPTPPTAFRVKRTREVDVHARNLDAWDQDYVQTSPGVFQGQVRELFDGPLQRKADERQVAEGVAEQHEVETQRFARADGRTAQGGRFDDVGVGDVAEALHVVRDGRRRLEHGRVAVDPQVHGEGLTGEHGRREAALHLAEAGGVAAAAATKAAIAPFMSTAPRP